MRLSLADFLTGTIICGCFACGCALTDLRLIAVSGQVAAAWTGISFLQSKKVQSLSRNKKAVVWLSTFAVVLLLVFGFSMFIVIPTIETQPR